VTFTNLELAGAIDGAGDIQKLGAATLVFSADSPGYTGTIQILEGAVSLNGAMPNAEVELAGGSLSGPAAVGTLTVYGTPSSDVIRIRPGTEPGGVEVVVSGVSQGSFHLSERLVVRAGGGHDVVDAAASVDLSLWLFGEAGHDLLKGGAGDDVLSGGDGFDLLYGGSGRDLVIGGPGLDLVVGGGGDDIVIGGTFAYDAHDEALLAIQAEWTSGRSYPARVANLRGEAANPEFVNRANGDFFLIAEGPDATVFDDGALDGLSGGFGSDWFFANFDGGHRDLLIDRAPSELIDDVDS
jgi:autotransporter-associated beta strand protein